MSPFGHCFFFVISLHFTSETVNDTDQVFPFFVTNEKKTPKTMKKKEKVQFFGRRLRNRTLQELDRKTNGFRVGPRRTGSRQGRGSALVVFFLFKFFWFLFCSSRFVSALRRLRNEPQGEQQQQHPTTRRTRPPPPPPPWPRPPAPITPYSIKKNHLHHSIPPPSPCNK